jgi:hypothetical protein
LLIETFFLLFWALLIDIFLSCDHTIAEYGRKNQNFNLSNGQK